MKKNLLEGEIIALSLKDFFTKDMLKIALLPLLFTTIIMLTIFYLAASYGFDSLEIYVTQVQNGEEVNLNDDVPFYYVWLISIISFLFKYSITSWLVGILIYSVGTIFIMMFSIFLTIIIIGFLTPMILKILKKRHYKDIETQGFGSLLTPLWLAFKTVFIMILLFIILMPLYFIPLINIIAINFPFYYFFHKLLNFDVASTILNKDEYEVIYKKKKIAFRLRTLFLYFLSLIPSLMLFTAVFFIIYLGHGYFQELIKLRNREPNQDIEIEY